MKKLVVTGTILLNKAVNENVKHMVIKAPEIANLAEPGQFGHEPIGDEFSSDEKPAWNNA